MRKSEGFDRDGKAARLASSTRRFRKMSSLRKHLSILIAALALVFSGTSAFAQTVTGTITGTVTDATGGLIPGATVTVINEQTTEARNQATNEEGRFSFAALQPGVYTVKI